MAVQPPLPNRNARVPAAQRPRPRTQARKPKLPAGWRGTWVAKPKLNTKKWKVGKVGPKSKFAGKYVAKPIKPKPAKKPKPAAAATPPAAAVPDPDAALLERYKDNPEAQALIRALRGDQIHHEGYVSEKVLPWASGALQGLAQINQAAQAGLTGQAEAINQGVANAAGATPGMVSGVSGGVVASPNAYAERASSQAMAQQASTASQIAAWQQAMGTIQQATFAQGYIRQLSDYAKGLPELYARKRSELVQRIDEFIAEQQFKQAQLDEEMRRNRVDEAIRAMNAQTNAAIQFGRLGVDATRVAQQGQPDPVAPMPTDVPEGYVVVPNPDGTWRYIRDLTYERPGSGGSSGGGSSRTTLGRGEYTPNQLKKEGFKKLPKGAGKRYRDNAVVATDGSLWYKPGKKSSKPASSSSGSSGGSSSKPRSASALIKELRSLYKKDDIGGWEERFEKDPKGAGARIAYWVRENKKSFMVPGTRKVNMTKLREVLGEVGGRPAAHALDILIRGYMTGTGNNRVWK